MLQEFYVPLTRKLPERLPAEDAERALRDLAVRPVVPMDAERVLAGIAQSWRAKISFWDALIVEAALAGGAERILTEDLQHGQWVDGIRIENPFL